MSEYSPQWHTPHWRRGCRHQAESEHPPHNSNPFQISQDFVPPPSHLSTTVPEQRQVGETSERYIMTPTSIDAVDQVTVADVLCGRGAPNIYHPGNQYFRNLVRERQGDYTTLRRHEKGLLIREILNAIEEHGGRFLRQLPCGDWVKVHDSVSYEKTAQALREFSKTRNKKNKATAQRKRK